MNTALSGGFQLACALLNGARSALMIDALRGSFTAESARPPEASPLTAVGTKTREGGTPSRVFVT